MDVTEVHTREDLVAYVVELVGDWKASPEGWENNTVGTYLEALAGFLQDLDGFYLNRGLPVPEAPSWRTVAELLTAARVYE